jgi:pyrroloquinoline-quinone synthase
MREDFFSPNNRKIEDLMNQLNEVFLNELDQQIAAQHLLKHSFYHAWSEGELSQDCLKEYALQYYHHVKAFPGYLSALHSHTEDLVASQLILQNLVDEAMGKPNHPELWRYFAQSLGSTDEDIQTHVPNDEIKHLIATFRKICLGASVPEGLAALYAYESQIPSVSISKIEGLKKFYGMTHPDQWKYFTVHIDADEKHSAVERDLLSRYATSENSNNIKKAVQAILDALWNFLSGLCARYDIACTNRSVIL